MTSVPPRRRPATAGGAGPDRPAAPPARPVQCPICLDSYPLRADQARLFEFRQPDGYVPVDISKVASAVKREAIRRTAFFECPNPSKDWPAHHLPLLYAAYRPPIVVGLVGETRTGKTHLLAAMIGAIENGALAPYGLKADALDPVRHREFIQGHVVPLLGGGERLRSTAEGLVDFVDALLISSDAGTWPVAFFDVSGEDLSVLKDNTRFVNGVNALLFVADAAAVGSRVGEAGAAGAHRLGPAGERAYRSVLGTLHPGGGYLDVPATVVVNKADRVRFVPPVDRWLRRRDGWLDPARILAESRDVYAFLHRHRAAALLQPYHYCRHCTLHFVSATGGEAVDGRYPAGARPRRVLEPLLSLLAMHGVLGRELAAEVGR